MWRRVENGIKIVVKSYGSGEIIALRVELMAAGGAMLQRICSKYMYWPRAYQAAKAIMEERVNAGNCEMTEARSAK